MSNFGELFDRIFVVNLWGECRDRRLSIVRQFHQLGVTNYEFIPGINGRLQNKEDLITTGRLVQQTWEPYKWLNTGEIGCLMSHQIIWKETIHREYRRVLVVEDDASFTMDANAVFDECFAHLPSDWDIVHFHSHSGDMNDPGKPREHLSGNIYRGNNESGGTLCYAIKQRSANQCLSWSHPMKAAADGVTNWFSGYWDECQGFNGYIVHPFPCRPGKFQSLIVDSPEE